VDGGLGRCWRGREGAVGCRRWGATVAGSMLTGVRSSTILLPTRDSRNARTADASTGDTPERCAAGGGPRSGPTMRRLPSCSPTGYRCFAWAAFHSADAAVRRSGVRRGSGLIFYDQRRPTAARGKAPPEGTIPGRQLGKDLGKNRCWQVISPRGGPIRAGRPFDGRDDGVCRTNGSFPRH